MRRHVISLDPRKPELDCGFADLSFVFDDYPYVARQTISDIDCLLVGRYVTKEGVEPQVRSSYLLDNEPVPQEERLGIYHFDNGDKVLSIDVMEVPVGGILKVWTQVNGRDRHNLYRYVAVEESALTALTKKEYNALFEVPRVPDWIPEKLFELRPQVEQLLEDDDHYFLSRIFQTFRLTPRPGDHLPIRVRCSTRYARPTWWDSRHVRLIEDAAFNQMDIANIIWGREPVTHEKLLGPEAEDMILTEELQAEFDAVLSTAKDGMVAEAPRTETP